jgi:DNA-binding beta-propeller fold protein YncE
VKPSHARTLLCLVATLAVAVAGAEPSTTHYALADGWTLGGTGGWDYLAMDEPRGRLFLSRADHVEVVDAHTGKVLGSIAATQGVHGIALAPDLKRGYTSNGRANSITVFDYDTLGVVREVPVPGDNPDAILYDPASRHVFTFNGRSHDATVFDAETLAVVAKLPMPDKPEFAATDGRGHVFVNIESEAGELLEIDSLKSVVLHRYKLPGCASPSGLAIDALHGRLFSVCDANVMAVTDARTGRAVARVRIGAGPDAAAYDPVRGLVFSSNGEGTLTVIRQQTPDRYAVVENLPTAKGARTMALDVATGRVFLVTAAFGPAPAPTADQPHPRPAILPDTFKVLVAAPR